MVKSSGANVTIEGILPCNGENGATSFYLGQFGTNRNNHICATLPKVKLSVATVTIEVILPCNGDSGTTLFYLGQCGTNTIVFICVESPNESRKSAVTVKGTFVVNTKIFILYF